MDGYGWNGDAIIVLTLGSLAGLTWHVSYHLYTGRCRMSLCRSVALSLCRSGMLMEEKRKDKEESDTEDENRNVDVLYRV